MNAKARRNADKFGSTLGERLPDGHGLRLAATSRGTARPAPRPHTDDLAVDKLASAQKAKLALCRTMGRRGWDSPLECSIELLANLLAEAVGKGDPVDIANYAAMLHSRGASHQVIAEHALRALLRGSRELCVMDQLNAGRYQVIRDADHGAPLQDALRVGGTTLDAAADETIAAIKRART
ncbi:hypothetical protein [Cupriavidus basilensis]|uniref:hypothetical protein n=1 Tax=Cupriavidus basilensis TaxID=68895 RepID=UPI0039F64B70